MVFPLYCLIITIIAIIILAAIVIFTGLNTLDRANLAKFVSEFSDFRMAVTQDYMQKKARYAIEGKWRSDAQIYYIIANKSDTITDVNLEPTVDNAGTTQYPGTIMYIASGDGDDSLGLDGLDIKGEYAYLITDDRNVVNWKQNRKYFEVNEQHWITDKGDVFITKGYRVEQNGEEKWYLNEKVVSDTPATGNGGISVNNVRILASNTGNTEAGTNLVNDGSVRVYIMFDVTTEDGSSVTISPDVPYGVSDNGTYSFVITATNGKRKNYKVTVNNFKEPTLTNTGYKIGDIVAYQATTTSNDGYASDTEVAPGVTAKAGTVPQTGIIWKILSISDSEIKITPGIVNSDQITMSGIDAFKNCTTGLNTICNKLYKNTALNLPVTNMTIEELNYASNKFDPAKDYDEYGTKEYNVAFYPAYTNLSSTINHTQTGDSNKTVKAGTETDTEITIVENGVECTYTKIHHSDPTYYFYTGDGMEERIYGGEGNGNAAGGHAIIRPYKDEEGMYYPVFLKGTYYSYYPDERQSGLDKVLGGKYGLYGWLASPFLNVRSYDSSAYFSIRYAYGNDVYYKTMANSYSSTVYSHSCGLLPVVSLSPTCLTRKGSISGLRTTETGTESDPWGVK